MTNKLTAIAQDSARGGFFLFAGNTSQLLIVAIGSIIIARLLGPDSYGLYSLALVVPSIFLGLIDFGVNSALTRFSAKLKAEGNFALVAGLLKSGMIFKVLTGVAMSSICLIFSDTFAAYLLNRPELGSLVQLTAVVILFQSVFNALNSSFTGIDRMEGNAVTMNVQAVMKTILSPALIFAGFTVAGALLGHIVSYAVASLVGTLFFITYYKALSAGASVKKFTGNIKLLLGYGFPLYTSSLLALVQGQYQTIILAFFVSNTVIGNFTIAVTLSALLNVLLFPIGALFPAFSKLNADDDEMRWLFRMSTKYTALLVIPATVLVGFLANDLILTLYGSSYGLAPAFFQLYILNFLLTGVGSAVIGYLFNGVGMTTTVFKYSLVNLIMFLPLAPILAMLYGVVGLIAAFLVSNGCSLGYALFIAYKKMGVRLDVKASLKIYLASFLSVLPIILLIELFPLNGIFSLAVCFPLFLFMYLVLLPLTGAINLSDVKNFQAMFEKVKLAWLLLKYVLKFELIMICLRSKLSKQDIR
jgi:O-antigen/teichoic acid export membrane protein